MNIIPLRCKHQCPYLFQSKILRHCQKKKTKFSKNCFFKIVVSLPIEVLFVSHKCGETNEFYFLFQHGFSIRLLPLVHVILRSSYLLQLCLHTDVKNNIFEKFAYAVNGLAILSSYIEAAQKLTYCTKRTILKDILHNSKMIFSTFA